MNHHKKRNTEYHDKHDTDKHNDKQKARTAALVLTGTDPHIFHIQLQAMLNAVDAFVLSTMIHKGALNILHPGYERQIAKENHKPHDALRDHDQDL